MAYCTYMCQCIWVNLVHTGAEIQASTFLKHKSHGATRTFAPCTINFQKDGPGSAQSGVVKLRNQTAVKTQRDNKRTERQGQNYINTAKLESKKTLMPRREKKTQKIKTGEDTQGRLSPINPSSARAAHCFPLSGVY